MGLVPEADKWDSCRRPMNGTRAGGPLKATAPEDAVVGQVTGLPSLPKKSSAKASVRFETRWT